MKKFLLICSGILAVSFFTSCSSLKKMGMNSVSTMLAGSDAKGRMVEKKAGDPDPMVSIMGETDTVLVADFIPVALKMYEVMQSSNPSHLGLTAMCGQLNVTYANAFIQAPAETLSVEFYDKKASEMKRAESHYIKGAEFCFDVLEKKYPGIKNAVLSSDEKQLEVLLPKLKKEDVNTIYWAGAGRLGAFSLNPLKVDYLDGLPGIVAMLEKASDLDKDYSGGALWSLLFTFYVSAPADFCGNTERGLECYQEALRCGKGVNAGHYVAYAQSYCIPHEDEEGFDEAIEKALSIDLDANPELRLMNVIFMEKAQLLKDTKEDYFLAW